MSHKSKAGKVVSKPADTSKPSKAKRETNAPASMGCQTRARNKASVTNQEDDSEAELPQAMAKQVAKKPCRTPAEMAVVREADEKKKRDKQAAQVKSLHALADMENEISTADAAIKTPRNVPGIRIRPPPKKKATTNDVDSESDSTGALGLDVGADAGSEYQEDSEMIDQPDQDMEETPVNKKAVSKRAPKAAVESEEEFDLTPIAKKTKGKASLATRAAINGQRLVMSLEYAGIDQKDVKPKQDASKLVTILVVCKFAHAHSR